MSAPEGRPSGPVPRAAMRVAVAGAAVLALLAAVTFYYAAQANRRSDVGSVYQVAITARACDPGEITVPAGRTVFEIVNRSDRPVEWEILDGVMVVEERENIPPGFSQTLAARLAPGEYQITCGLLSNPRGTLHVRATGATVDVAMPDLRAFVGALAEYKVFLGQQGAEMVEAAGRLKTAIDAGDVEAARALYEPARLPYRRIEPLAYRFADLANAINPLADYLEGREADPAFTGFHRIEYGLFARQSTEGLAPLAARLLTDLVALRDRLQEVRLGPVDLVDGAARQAELLARGHVESGENRYAHTDLADFEASLAGIAKIVGLLTPVISDAAPDAAAAAQDHLAAVQRQLTELRREDGFPSYQQIDEASRGALAHAFQDLAEAIKALVPDEGMG